MTPPLVRFDDVYLEFGDQPLLLGADFAIGPAERVCLVGRNGAGKTSMLKLISGELEPDRGNVYRNPDIHIAQLEQDLPAGLDETVREHVSSGLAELRSLRDEYERRAHATLDRQGMNALEALQHRIEAHGGWQLETRVEAVASELELPISHRLSEVAGGWRRLVALARALVSDPDLLLLDEPTNHLDLGTIEWLEGRVDSFPGSVLFITHDRALVGKLASRIVDLDRGRITSWPGRYAEYLEKKEKALEDEARRDALFDKKLAAEEAWVREGIKARRTRNEGRVRTLIKLRETRARRLATQSKADLRLGAAQPSGRKVIEARDITHAYGDRALIRNFSLQVMRGDRIGIIGNNGVGKTTLLRILLGECVPGQGSVELGTRLEIAYFDQLRDRLEPDKTVADNVGEGRDFVEVDGKSLHIISYLERFLFTGKRARTPVKALSGGERNRVILAKLFARPANLLVLDEPTNDLDVETLEVLEERLVRYDGTLIVVSHDRVFIDNVVTSVLVFEDDGAIREYVGGYSDWVQRGCKLATADNPSEAKTRPVPSERSGPPPRDPPRPRKLSYKLQLELDRLPDEVDSLEGELDVLRARAAEPGFYTQPYEQVQDVLERLAAKEQELERAFERWAELEGQREAMKNAP